MLNFSEIQQYVNEAMNVSVQPPMLQKIISLIDLTSLNETDSQEDILALCNQANTEYGHVAAICVYPQFVKFAASQLAGSSVKIATVVNFPFAKDSLISVVQLIDRAIKDGAQEIDLVFPYQDYLAGNKQESQTFIQTCKQACGDEVLLKVILEISQLQSNELIAEVSRFVLLAGADFIKTSTGKLGGGATLEAAAVMLLTIRDMSNELNRVVGFKASGGIRTIEQAAQFIELANQILGPHWVNSTTFRLGASQLLENVFTRLKKMSCPF